MARASPEGERAHNTALSRDRAKAVLKHLEEKFKDPDLEKQVGLLWLGEEFAQLGDEFCGWSRSHEAVHRRWTSTAAPSSRGSTVRSDRWLSVLGALLFLGCPDEKPAGPPPSRFAAVSEAAGRRRAGSATRSGRRRETAPGTGSRPPCASSRARPRPRR